MMHQLVYLLCAASSVLCAGLLARSYRWTRTPLLLWSMLCFVGLAVNNAVMVIDVVALPDVDLSPWRDLSAFVALTLLVVGLVWEVRS
jgi:hypothetical protein